MDVDARSELDGVTTNVETFSAREGRALTRKQEHQQNEGADASAKIRRRRAQQVAQGLLYKEIAIRLAISPETVKKHLKNIYQKLHVQNKVEALNKFSLLLYFNS